MILHIKVIIRKTNFLENLEAGIPLSNSRDSTHADDSKTSAVKVQEAVTDASEISPEIRPKKSKWRKEKRVAIPADVEPDVLDEYVKESQKRKERNRILMRKRNHGEESEFEGLHSKKSKKQSLA